MLRVCLRVHPVGEDGAVALADSLLAADDEDVYLAVVAFDRGDRRTWRDRKVIRVAAVFDPVPPVPGAVVPDPVGEDGAVGLADSLLAADDEDVYLAVVAFDRGDRGTWRDRKVIPVAGVFKAEPPVPVRMLRVCLRVHPVGEDGAVAADDEDVYLAVVAFDRGDRGTWLDLETIPVAEVFDPVPPVPGAVVPDPVGEDGAVAADDEDVFVMAVAFDRGDRGTWRDRKVIPVAGVFKAEPPAPVRMLRVCLRVHPVGEDGAVALADSLLAADDEDVYLAVVAFDRGDRRTWRDRKVIRVAAVFDPVPPVP